MATKKLISKVVVVGTDQAITASTTLAAITELVFPLVANDKHLFRAYIPFTLAGTASGYKFGVTAPGTPTLIRAAAKVFNNTAGTMPKCAQVAAEGEIIAGALAAAGTHWTEIVGWVQSTGSAGNLQFTFAQNVSDAGAITIENGAWVEVSRALPDDMEQS